KIDKSVFPGEQGGPLMHVIAAKAVAFKEAMEPSFKKYQEQVVKNSQAMAETFKELGYRVISGGTENHLVLIDIKSKLGITGKKAEEALYKVNITINKNSIPFDKEKPAYTSGIRVGSADTTTKGFKEADFRQVVLWIHEVLTNLDNEIVLEKVKREVIKLTSKHN